MAKTRRKLTAIVKAKVPIDALKEREMLSTLAARFEIILASIWDHMEKLWGRLTKVDICIT